MVTTFTSVITKAFGTCAMGSNISMLSSTTGAGNYTNAVSVVFVMFTMVFKLVRGGFGLSN